MKSIHVLISNTGVIYAISLSAALSVSLIILPEKWPDSNLQSYAFEVVFCFSPGVLCLPRESEKAVPLCCTSPPPPGRSRLSTVATCSISPPNVNTLNPFVSCTSQWRVFVSSGMSTGMNAVWTCVLSVTFVYTAIRNWHRMSGLDIKDSFQFDDALLLPHWGQCVMRFVVTTLRSSFESIPLQVA